MSKEYSYGICPYRIQDGSIYLLLNKTSEHSKYNFFKGKIEYNESIGECAIREFYEEAGILLNVNRLELYFYQNNPKKFIGIFLVDFNNHNQNFIFDKREIYEADWVKIREVNISKNQNKILSDMILFFKPKEFWIKHLKDN